MTKRIKDEVDLSTQIRINTEVDYEVRHWARQLQVSRVALLAAVDRVGPLVHAVRQYINDQPRDQDPGK